MGTGVLGRSPLGFDPALLRAIGERVGTPTYVYSANLIRAQYHALDDALKDIRHRICYSVKANGNIGVLRVLKQLGAGADIVSGFELEAALRAGFPPKLIVFSGVGKTTDEIARGLDAGIGEFNAESEEELGRISAAASARGRTVGVTLRVNPDIDPKSHAYISTGLRQNKFGVDIALAPDILRRARNLPGLAIAGVQCHIGSQITDLEPMEQAVRDLVALSNRLLADGFPLRVIDIGGGLGVDYEGGTTLQPAALAARLVPHLEGLPLTVLVEPGRSIVGAAGALLTRVLYLKENRGKQFVIVDAGLNDLLRPALYSAFHRVEPVVSRGGALRATDTRTRSVPGTRALAGTRT